MDQPLRKTLSDVVAFLQVNHVEHALIGGVAISVRGHPRMTADVDLVVGIDVERAVQLLDNLEDTSFQPLFQGVREVIERSYILPLLHREAMVRVDLSIGLSGFERQVIARADVQNVLGTDVAVATAEDLIIMKSLAGRPQDEQDIRSLALAHGKQLDWNYCEATATELGNAIGIDLIDRIRELRDQASAE